MIAEDFHQILLRHKVKELDALKACSRVLFVDTDALTTRFYSRFLICGEEEIRQCEALADAITALNSYDLILFLSPPSSLSRTAPEMRGSPLTERNTADR